MAKDVIYNLEIWSLACLILEGLECNHKHSFKREAEGVSRQVGSPKVPAGINGWLCVIAETDH